MTGGIKAILRQKTYLLKGKIFLALVLFSHCNIGDHDNAAVGYVTDDDDEDDLTGEDGECDGEGGGEHPHNPPPSLILPWLRESPRQLSLASSHKTHQSASTSIFGTWIYWDRLVCQSTNGWDWRSAQKKKKFVGKLEPLCDQIKNGTIQTNKIFLHSFLGRVRKCNNFLRIIIFHTPREKVTRGSC